MEKRVRVRFSPSPTGPAHLGSIRTCLYNYLFAKKNEGDFILRIEDTDQDRFVNGAEEYIIESLKWCGIEPSEGVGFGDGPHAPYKQSERNKLNIYKPYADKLIEAGLAYYAFDTIDEINAAGEKWKSSGSKIPFSYGIFTRDLMKNSLILSSEQTQKLLDDKIPYVIRLKIPKNETIKVDDIIRGQISVKSNIIDDKVLFKSNGGPTYHLANVVDDHLMEITHVIRGEEWLPSLSFHYYLYDCFGWEPPKFCHLPLILGPDGKKLSKRDGDALGFPVFPMEWKDPASKEVSSGYKENGYLPSAFLNIIALLGWNPGANAEIFSLDEMVDKFSFDRVGKSGAKFDLKKSEWINHQYLKATDNKVLADLWVDIMTKDCHASQDDLDSINRDYMATVCGLLKEKVSTVGKFWEAGEYMFFRPAEYRTLDELRTDELFAFMQAFKEALHGIKPFDKMNTSTCFNDTVRALNVQPRDAGKILRACICDNKVGPPMFDILELLGWDEVNIRLNNALSNKPVSAHE